MTNQNQETQETKKPIKAKLLEVEIDEVINLEEQIQSLEKRLNAWRWATFALAVSTCFATITQRIAIDQIFQWQNDYVDLFQKLMQIVESVKPL